MVARAIEESRRRVVVSCRDGGNLTDAAAHFEKESGVKLVQGDEFFLVIDCYEQASAGPAPNRTVMDSFINQPRG